VVKACRSTLPSVPSVLLFDTLFHQTIPKHITTYPISQNPSSYSGAPIRRYGFHGLSYASVLNTMSKQLNKSEDDCNLVVAHLGSGGSVCMIRGGKSMETSMGLTPLEGGYRVSPIDLRLTLDLGLMGGTRSGSVDPSIAFHLLGREAGEMVDWNGLEISRGELLLNKESGFLGASCALSFSSLVTDRHW
jgi:acetate kinase